MLKLSVILSLALVGTVFADLQSDDHDAHCSAGDGALVQEEWDHLWEDSDSTFKVELAKHILLE